VDNVADYPLKGLADVRSAIVFELASFLQKLDFSFPKTTEPFRFAPGAVYPDWPTWNTRAMSAGGMLPAAAILPDRPTFVPSCLTPSFLDETWSGGDPTLLNPDGSQQYPLGDASGRGFGLFKVSEIDVPIVVLFRAVNKPQRRAIMRTLEQAFVDSVGIDHTTERLPMGVAEALVSPPHYGRFLKLTRYYNRQCRFVLQASQLLDSEALAGANRWIGQLEISANTSVCVLRRVRGMTPQVRLTLDDQAEDRSAGAD
jgi:hypothetical protein